MKKNILLAVIGILLFCCGFQLANIMDKHKEPQHTPETEAQTDIQDFAEIDEEAEISNECNGITLADSIQICDYKSTAMKLVQLAEPHTLFARFSATACRPCLDALLASLENFAAEHPNWSIVMLISNIQLRDLYVMQPQFGPQFRMLACDNLPIDFNDGDTPVLFRIDAGGRIYDHFTTRYGDYNRTDTYLKNLT